MRQPLQAEGATMRSRPDPRISRLAPVLLAGLASVIASAGAAAQPSPESAQAALDGAALAELLPTSLGGARRRDHNAYSRFATAGYPLPDGSLVTLQIHEVAGAGAEAHQRSVCRTWTRIGGYEACVAQRQGGVSLIWVLSDTLQVMLGAPTEQIGRRLAAEIGLGRLARLAERGRAAR
jgi:hypothetical protein